MYPLIRLAGNIALSNVTDLRAPYKLTYALTYRCQLKCRMCNIWRRKPADELTVSEIGDFFRKSRGFSWVNLTGGEISLREDLPEVFQAVAREGQGLYMVNFPTNGYQPEIVAARVREVLQDGRIPRLAVTVSLDGPPLVHERIRNVPGAWDRAVETFRLLRRLKDERFDVYFGMTLQDANADAYEDTVCSVRESLADIRYTDFHVNVMHTSSHYYGNTGVQTGDRQQIAEALCRVRALRQDHGFNPLGFLERRYQKVAEGYLRGERPTVACQALSASLFMDPSGTVYPCTIFDRPIGNIRDFGFDLRRLWNSDERRAVREEIVAGQCPQCWTPCEAYPSLLADLLPVKRR